jgi:hypothetical protein
MADGQFSPQQLEDIREAILDGFRRTQDLEIILHFKWGLLLERYFDLKRGTYYIVSDLLNWTEERGKTRELVALAYAERPDNPPIKQVAESLGLSLPAVQNKYDLTKPLPPKPALEALVKAQSRFVNFDLFLSRFRSLGDRICRVETSKTMGTGFLVGPDLVLTNFHVMERVKGAAEAAQVVCRFDYHAPAGAPSNGSKQYRLADDWLLANSPYSQSDLTGEGEAKPDELDYALLRISEPVGDSPARQGEARGWFDLNVGRPLLAVRDFAVVPQHPQGRTLEVAWGAVVAFNASGNRVRYDVTTDTGSSGSPCFSIELEPFALHHAADPDKKPKYNQAIPLDLIARDLNQKKAL